MIPARKRCTWILATLAGLPAVAAAQELIRVSYAWHEVVGLTTTPVTNPNSILDPGEGARIGLSIEALINGSNAIGQTTTYTPPPPPGVGTVRGISSFIYSLRGDGGASSAAGTWGPRSCHFPGIVESGLTGNVLLNGAFLDSFASGQFAPPGSTAFSDNPINNVFRGVWAPVDYSPRTVHWIAEPGSIAPLGQHNGIIVSYGITRPDPNDPTTWYDNYLTKYISSDFGNGVSIPIAPAPATGLGMCVFALGPLIRKQRDKGTRR